VESAELGVKVKVIARDDVERVHEHEGCKAGDRVHDCDEFDELAGAPDRLYCTTEEHEGRGIEAYLLGKVTSISAKVFNRTKKIWMENRINQDEYKRINHGRGAFKAGRRTFGSLIKR
jgi:hypothetical protein